MGMLILAIESSCDDTSAAVVKAGEPDGGYHVLSSIVASQDDIHGKYGGIVPELASRRHIESIIPVVEEALACAGVSINGDIDGIGVTRGPGLVGSILIGLCFAKSVAYVKGIPFVGVNHIEGHALSPFLSDGDDDNGLNTNVPVFPFVSLIVSGGHTSLFLVKGFTDFTVLGQTRDDAAGEAFDKVAKLLGLSYPGGVYIDRLAKEGNPHFVEFKRAIIQRGNLEFSFSGLKTGVLNEVKKLDLNDGELPDDGFIKDISASFQECAVDVLVKKSLWAVDQCGVDTLVVAGGVACNSRLREKMAHMAKNEGIKLFIPPPKYCSDNAAMIAVSAYNLLQRGDRGTLDLNADPSLVVGG